jgi:hypothetical protein
MNLLNIFNKAPKGDSYRIVENPIKYVGFILSEALRKGNSTSAKTKTNPSTVASTDNSRGTLPK